MKRLRFGAIPVPGSNTPGILDLERSVLTTADFTTTVTGEDLPCQVEVHLVADHDTATLEVESLKLKRTPGGPPIDATMLRKVPVATIRREAVRAASIPVELTYDENGEWTRWTIRGGENATPTEVPEDVVRELAPRKPRATPDEILEDQRKAAEAHDEAWRNGEPLYAAVQAALHCSLSTAKRRLGEAKAAGLTKEGTDR